MQFILRQNPSNPCQLQQSLDGGDTWTLAFDYSRCGLYLPPESGTVDRPAALIRNIYQELVQRTADLCAGTRDDAIASLTAWMRTYDAAYSNPAALGDLYDQVCALSPEDLAEATSDCAYLEQYQSLEACDSITDLYDWLNCASETLNSTLNTWSNDLFNTLNAAAAALGLSGLAAFLGGSGGGGGGSFGAGCEVWQWHFEGSDPAFTYDHAIIGPGGATGNCLTAPIGAWHNGVNYSHGAVFEAELLTDGIVTAVTFKQKAFTTPGYTGTNVYLVNSDGSIAISHIATDNADLTWRDISFEFDWSVVAGQKIRVQVTNSDNNPATLNNNDHHLDDVVIEGIGISF